MENLILQTRGGDLANMTKVIRFGRSDTQSFKQVEIIRQIFRDPDYPKHFPNTVIPEYTCTQHAKYELVLRALEKRYFSHTKYIAWIDIGHFKYLTTRRKPFYVVTPPGMRDDAIAMTELQRKDSSLTPYEVMRGNLVWTDGGLSLGTRDAYHRFAEEYLAAVETLLKQGLSNTDQQVIYSMWTDTHRLSHRVSTTIHTYTWCLNSVSPCWFYLGSLCYKEVS